MQTPKQYSEELVNEMYNSQDEQLRWTPDAINCAKVAVKRLLKIANKTRTTMGHSMFSDFDFLTEVLNELNEI